MAILAWIGASVPIVPFPRKVGVQSIMNSIHPEPMKNRARGYSAPSPSPSHKGRGV